MKLKNVWIVVFGGFIVISLAFKFFGSVTAEKIARTMNETFPKKVSDTLRIEKVVADEGTLQFTYTYIGDELIDSYKTAMKNDFESMAFDMYCRTGAMKEINRAGIPVYLSLVNTSGNYIAELYIDTHECLSFFEREMDKNRRPAPK